jgi:Tfp pilus assembly protein PilN
MVHPCHHVPNFRIFVLLLLASALLPGCGIVPRSRMDECQRLSQLLRSENARLKDRVLALQSQNRDYADRAVDDLRRLTARDQAIERLEQDIRSYQDDRERLAAAYEQLRVSLGRRPADDQTGQAPEHAVRNTTNRMGDRLSVSNDSLRKTVPRGDDHATTWQPLPGRDNQTAP